MNEKLIEKKLTKAVKNLNGLALKISSPYFRGMPDRLVLMPKRMVYWAEIKTTGQKLRDQQEYVVNYLRELGQEVWVIDSEEKLQQFIKHIQTP